MKPLDEYAHHWVAGTKPAQPIAGIQGRFCRMRPGDPTALSDDPDRRIVFLVDEDTCHASLGVPGYSVCIGIGWDAAYTKAKVDAGYRFAWVVFPESACPLGDWQNMLAMVVEMYPEVAAKIGRHRHALTAMTPASLRDLERRVGFKLFDVDSTGRTDTRFLSLARYRDVRDGSPEDTADAARRFLYHVVHLKELYRGDGKTQNAQGTVGCNEYIMPAKPLAALDEHREFPIAVTIPKVHGVARPPSRGELPPPPFFDADNAALWSYTPRLEGSVAGTTGLSEHAATWRERYGITPASKDAFKIALLIIDAQNDFCHPDGALYVAGRSGDGAIVDCANTARFVYANAAHITRVDTTMDTHFAHQIFFASFWRQPMAGGKLGPVTANREITTEQIRRGEIVPNPAVAAIACGGNYPWLLDFVQHYTKSLETAGKYKLWLWPPHCILGSLGHALNGVVFEASMFHSYARSANFNPKIKGGHILTENYSVMSPEVLTRHDGMPLAARDSAFLKTLLAYDAVVTMGQAASHCVKSSIDDILGEIAATDPSLAKKVHVVTNCMSAVVIPGGPDFTPQADAAYKRFADAGMHLVTTETPMREWPGIRGNL